MAADARRKVPALDALLRSDPGRRAAATLGRPLLKAELQRALDEVRGQVAPDNPVPADDEILARAIGRASAVATGLEPVINATGVVLHTGLGRAPLSEEAARAAARAARSYTDLEVDRETGGRGRRTGRAELLLAALTGAPAALVVNNCAAALLLTLATVAKGKEVIVSRGELIEIGGEFRIPDILSASGAKLVEVGTTNRTRISDYKNAVSKRTGAILKVHPSNYRVVGFTSVVAAKDLAAVANAKGIPFIFDVGSGLLAHSAGMPPQEPSVTEALADGADLVTFSADKLLGGPQAGCVVGSPELIQRLRKNPIARAVRVDKMQVAALESVLGAHSRGTSAKIPVHHMLAEHVEDVAARAHQLSEALAGDLGNAHVRHCESVVGGGSMPGTGLPSWGVQLRVADPPAFAARLRTGSPSVFCRVEQEHLMFDVRTVFPAQIPHLARAIQYALEGDDLDEE